MQTDKMEDRVRRVRRKHKGTAKLKKGKNRWWTEIQKVLQPAVVYEPRGWWFASWFLPVPGYMMKCPWTRD